MLNCAGEETLSLCSRPALAFDRYAGSDSAQSLEADWTRLHQELFSRGDPLAVSETVDEHHIPLLKRVLLLFGSVTVYRFVVLNTLTNISMVLETAKTHICAPHALTRVIFFRATFFSHCKDWPVFPKLLEAHSHMWLCFAGCLSNLTE